MATGNTGGDQTPAKAKEQEPNAIQYKGSSDVRQITKAQWAKAGVEDQNLVRWSAENDFTVKTSDLSAAALKVLEKDSDLKPVVVEA